MSNNTWSGPSDLVESVATTSFALHFFILWMETATNFAVSWCNRYLSAARFLANRFWQPMPSVCVLAVADPLHPFQPFTRLSTAEDIEETWRVLTKVKHAVQHGPRLENLAWRLWCQYQHKSPDGNQNHSIGFGSGGALKEQVMMQLEQGNVDTAFHHTASTVSHKETGVAMEDVELNSDVEDVLFGCCAPPPSPVLPDSHFFQDPVSLRVLPNSPFPETIDSGDVCTSTSGPTLSLPDQNNSLVQPFPNPFNNPPVLYSSSSRYPSQSHNVVESTSNITSTSVKFSEQDIDALVDLLDTNLPARSADVPSPPRHGSDIRLDGILKLAMHIFERCPQIMTDSIPQPYPVPGAATLSQEQEQVSPQNINPMHLHSRRPSSTLAPCSLPRFHSIGTPQIPSNYPDPSLPLSVPILPKKQHKKKSSSTPSLAQHNTAVEYGNKSGCDNCHTFETSLWRRDPRDASRVLCNACLLYKKAHGHDRPAEMRKDKIKKRKRSKIAVLNRENITVENDHPME